MGHEESLVTSLFKVLNLIALGSVGFYYFKTRVLQQIKDMMREKKKHEKALQNEKHALDVKLKKIEDEIIQQQQLCADVKENVAQWNAVVAQEQEEFLREEEEKMKEHEERVKKQSMYLTTLKIQQRVLPKAFDEAQVELEREFTLQRGHVYMQNVVRHIRKA